MRSFNEIQRFTQWWLVALLLSSLLFLIYAFYQWYIIGVPVGNTTPDNVTAQLILIFSILPLFILFYFLKLRTEINEKGISFQFTPFHASEKILYWNDIKNCYVRTYKPLTEYGGWGLKTSFNKMGPAYTVKGTIGIQIELNSGKKILIGTQKKEEAEKIIQRYLNKTHE